MGVDEGFAAFNIVDPGVGNVGVHAGEGVLAYKACDVFVGDEIRGDLGSSWLGGAGVGPRGGGDRSFAV